MNQKMNVAQGVFYGTAYGDALGYRVEFMGMKNIHILYGTKGPVDLTRARGNYDKLARVSDDTQMTLAVARALIEAKSFSPFDLSIALQRQFNMWYRDPKNTRAPGITCMGSCARMKNGMPWQLATNLQSKGNGVNMRVAPVGLLPLDVDAVTGIAQLQAAVTHAHPTALAAADLTAYLVYVLRKGAEWEKAIDMALARCAEQRGVYREDYLGNVLNRTGTPYGSPTLAMEAGWDQLRDALVRMEIARDCVSPHSQDACKQLAMGGWTAEEALALALYACTRYEDRPLTALATAIRTSGDSDSIGAITGALLGARHGVQVFPAEWLDMIEYGPQLRALSSVFGDVESLVR